MTLLDNNFIRAMFLVGGLALLLGFVGNLASGVTAHAAGYALFGLVLISPGIAIVTMRRTKRETPTRPPPGRQKLLAAARLVVLAIIGAIAASFVIVVVGVVLGAGSERYPNAATRLLILSGIIGVPLVAVCGFLLWQSAGPKRHLLRGMARAAAGKLPLALQDLEAYLQRRPDDPAGWEGTAVTLLSLGRGEEALAQANHSVKLRRRWQSLLARGLVLSQLGAMEEACADLEESLNASGSPIVQSSLGSVLVSLRRLDSAVAMLETSYSRVSWMGTVLALGEAYRLLGMASEAESAYEDAASLGARAGNAGGAAVRAYSLAQLGRLDEAVETARSILGTEGAGDLALCALALASIRRSDLRTAEESLVELADRSPHSAVQVLTDPDFSGLLADDRFRRLLSAAMLARDEQVNRARRLLAGEDGPGVP